MESIHHHNLSIEGALKASSISLFVLSAICFMVYTTQNYTHAEGDDEDLGYDITSANASVTVGTACTFTATVDSEHNATIANGIYSTDIGKTTLNTICNDSGGYAVYAIGYSNDEYGATDLTSDISSTYNISTGTNTSGDSSSWAMKLAQEPGTTTATIENGYDNYNIVPDDYTKVASLNTVTDNTSTTSTTGSSISTTYQTYISPTQPAGTYSGKVKYTLVHPSMAPKPEKPPTDLTFTAGEHIDTLMVADSSQGWASFYVTSSSAEKSIVFTAPTENTKYIVTVVPEAGYVLSSDPASSSYIEEFPTGTLSSNTLLTTVYTTSDVGNNITISAARADSDSAHPAYTAMQNLTMNQCPAYTDTMQGVNVTDSRDNKSYAVAKFGDYCSMLSNLRLDGGTELTTSTSNVSSAYTLPVDTGDGGWVNDYCKPYMASINGEYYYNWPAATARTNSTTGTSSCSNDTNNSVGDICPVGWSLLEGGATPLWNDGANPGMLSTTGGFISGTQHSIGSHGYWWTKWRDNSNEAKAYYLDYGTYFNISNDRWGYYSTKYKGCSVRCVSNN